MLVAFKIKLENTFEIFQGSEFDENFKQYIESKAEKIFTLNELVPDLLIDILKIHSKYSTLERVKKQRKSWYRSKTEQKPEETSALFYHKRKDHVCKILQMYL